jgi:pyridoxine 4-dehydrogenase
MNARRKVAGMDIFTFSGSLAGRAVGRIGFGAMQLPGPGVTGPPRDRDEALQVLRRAVELGVNHIDTAQYYGPEVSNQLIHDALHPYPEDLLLVSKVGARRDEQGGWLPAQTPAELRAGVEDNLRTLGVEQLGAVNLRRLPEDELPDGIQPVALEDQLAELVGLRDEGKIAGIGISNATLDEVEIAIDAAGIVCVQNPFSLLDRHDAEVLDRCSEAGIAYVPFFPLGSAFPGIPKVTDNEAVRAVAERVGATPAQVGLAWLLAHDEAILLIPGTSSLRHLEQNMQVGDLTLSERDLAELDNKQDQ